MYSEIVPTVGCVNNIANKGNDLVATTFLGIVGCHMVLFTTGRGTPFGGFVPTVKIATNSDLANKKKSLTGKKQIMKEIMIEKLPYLNLMLHYKSEGLNCCLAF